MKIEQLKETPDLLVPEVAKNILAEAEKHARGKGTKEVKTIAKSDFVARTIVSVAKRQKADVVVLESRGFGTGEGFQLGSAPHKVVSLTDCDVMTVRQYPQVVASLMLVE